jgi:hypothetical protein
MPQNLELKIAVVADALSWMTVIGCLQLALRHPEYVGPSSNIARQISEQLADKLLEEGVFSIEERAFMMRDQMRAENSRRNP